MSKKFDEFSDLVDSILENQQTQQLRRGQLLFNTLWGFDKEAAEVLRGTDDDPFYDDSKIVRFWTFLENRWQ
jgi:hypothetical protein